MSLSNSRSLFFLGFLACTGLMAAAFYLQYVVGLEPCPLCVVQRVCVLVFGGVCLLAALHNPGTVGRRLYAVLTALAAATGLATASRQVWLQSLPPDQLPDSCMAMSMDYIMEYLPLADMLRVMFTGTADCAEVTWTLFGMSIPEWSLLGFCAMLVLSAVVLLKRR